MISKQTSITNKPASGRAEPKTIEGKVPNVERTMKLFSTFLQKVTNQSPYAEKLLAAQFKKMGAISLEQVIGMTAECVTGRLSKKSPDKNLDVATVCSVIEVLTTKAVNTQVALAEHFLDWQEQGSGPQVLFTPSKSLVDNIITSQDLGVLLSDVKTRSVCFAQLIEKIKEGPADSSLTYWRKPADEIELLAGIIRVGLLESKTKHRINCSDEIRSWVRTTLEVNGRSPATQIGGISGFLAQQSGALGIRAILTHLGMMSSQLKQLFSQDLEVVSGDGVQTLDQVRTSESDPGNFPLDLNDGDFLDLQIAQVKDRQGRAVIVSPSRLNKNSIILNGSANVGGFGGVDPELVCKAFPNLDLINFGGAKNITEENRAETVEFLNAFHSQGKPVAVYYSETTDPEAEVRTWKALRDAGCVDILCMNPTEGQKILENIFTAEDHSLAGTNPELAAEFAAIKGLVNENRSLEKAEQLTWANAVDDPEVLVRTAGLIQRILEIPIIRLRSFNSEVVVTDSNLALSMEQQDRLSQDQIGSRYIAMHKLQTGSGMFTAEDSPLKMLNANILSPVAIESFYRYQELLPGLTAERLTAKNQAGQQVYIGMSAENYEPNKSSTVGLGDTSDSTFVALLADQGILPMANAVKRGSRLKDRK